MPSHKSLVTSHESPVKGSNSFRITYFRKNASANPYGSHTYKTKDLKPFRITYLQKKGRVAPPFSTGHPARPENSWQRLVRSMRVATSIIAGDSGLSVQLPTSRLEPPRRHESRVTSFKSSRFTLLSKNASANHLESHSCKNKGLKVPCFHTLTKKGVGEGGLFGSGHRS